MSETGVALASHIIEREASEPDIALKPLGRG
jgi:hypothetical protein